MEQKKNLFTDCNFGEEVDKSEVTLVEKLGDMEIGSEFTFDFRDIPITGEIVAIGANFKKADNSYFNAIIVLARGYNHLISPVA